MNINVVCLTQPLPEVGGTSPSKQQIQHIVDYFQHIYIHQEDRT
jgi:hypothetical protein